MTICNGSSTAGIVLDDDPARVDRAAVHAFISTSYWAAGRDRAADGRADRSRRPRRRPLRRRDGRQLGFARVVSDGRTVSYLADVYVLEEARGRGFGLELVRFAVDEGGLAGTKWILHTRDMHGCTRSWASAGPASGRWSGRLAGSDHAGRRPCGAGFSRARQRSASACSTAA